jgi:hypothetical protein
VIDAGDVRTSVGGDAVLVVGDFVAIMQIAGVVLLVWHYLRSSRRLSMLVASVGVVTTFVAVAARLSTGAVEWGFERLSDRIPALSSGDVQPGHGLLVWAASGVAIAAAGVVPLFAA